MFWFLIEPRFQKVNGLFFLTFNAYDSRIGHSKYFVPTEKVEDYIMLWSMEEVFLINQLKMI